MIERNRAFFEIFWKNGDLVEKDFLRNDGAKKLDVEEGLRLLDYDGKVMRLRQSAIQSPFEGGLKSSQKSKNLKSITFAKSSKWQEKIDKMQKKS